MTTNAVGLNRNLRPDSVTIASGTMQSARAFDWGTYAFGAIITPSGFNGASFTFKVSDGPVGTNVANYVPLYDGSGALVTLTVGASQAAPLPAELAGFRSVLLVANTNAVSSYVVTILRKA